MKPLPNFIIFHAFFAFYFCRILNEIDETIKLVKEFEATGISAIAVHGRKKHERPQHPVNTEAIRKIVENVQIPVIANGGSREMEKFNDILKFRELTGASSVMVARASQWNVSIFRRAGTILLSQFVVLQFAPNLKNTTF